MDLRRGGEDVHGLAPRPRRNGPTATAPKARPGWPTAARARAPARPRPRPRSSARSCGCGGATGSARSRSPAGSGMQASTVHAVLVRCRINRLSHIDRVTGEPLRRYEHPHPGSLIHVDVTKFGNIPDGGGSAPQPQQGQRNRASHRTPHRRTRQALRPLIGTAFVHTVIDDHSRVAYAEICTDEKAATAIGVLQRAVAWFADHGVTVERVLSDNGLPTGPTPGATPAPSSTSPTNEPGPTGPRPTARSNASTAPWPTAGPTPGSTTQPSSATPPCPAGCTSTITTVPTPPSEASHRSPD